MSEDSGMDTGSAQERSQRAAAKLEELAEALMARMSEELAKEGLADYEVVGFSVAPRVARARSFAADAAPCPTRCVVTPSGRIKCFPQC